MRLWLRLHRARGLRLVVGRDPPVSELRVGPAPLPRSSANRYLLSHQALHRDQPDPVGAVSPAPAHSAEKGAEFFNRCAQLHPPPFQGVCSSVHWLHQPLCLSRHPSLPHDPSILSSLSSSTGTPTSVVIN